MATKARTPKAPAAATVAPQAPAAAAPLYTLTAKQPRQGNTKQGAKSGKGAQWHTVATVAPSTRANAYAALAALASPFTQAQALAALAPVVAGTSGTPRSYWAAFVASGYIAAVGA